MLTDSTGFAPEWLKTAAIVGAIIGTILVVAAITVLTMGVGTTIMATSMAGAIIHGAAVGTLIGAGIGVTAGGIIGGATSDWSAEGILTGMGIGFGGGAVLGAIVGGSVGALQYSSAVSQWGSTGGKSAQQNMISHFNKHVVNEGHSYLGRNVIQSSRNARAFYNANQSLLTITNSGNYVIRGIYMEYKDYCKKITKKSSLEKLEKISADELFTKAELECIRHIQENKITLEQENIRLYNYTLL